MPTRNVILERIDALARISDEPRVLTRTYGSPAMRRANRLVETWMRQAGMKTRTDAVGNLIGHYPAAKSGAKILLLGSHLDTVPNAGKFDGPLGVVLAIAAVEAIHRRRDQLPFAIEIIAFADEEGVRFQKAYLGSGAVAGVFNRDDLKRVDANGISIAKAIRAFGGNPARLDSARMDSKRLIGYVEPHIEQGPVLDQRKLSLGIVTGIAGQTRASVEFVGNAGHAGTTPMEHRRDAFCAAAEFALFVEATARRTTGLVATVGQIGVQPNTSNVIPGWTRLSLDVRHEKDSVRRDSVEELRDAARAIASARKVKNVFEIVQHTSTVPCDGTFGTALMQVLRKHQGRVVRLPSGAGHDAAVMARITPVAMLFIRCKGGVSHHPSESVRTSDAVKAAAVLDEFIRELAIKHGA